MWSVEDAEDSARVPDEMQLWFSSELSVPDLSHVIAYAVKEDEPLNEDAAVTIARWMSGKTWPATWHGGVLARLGNGEKVRRLDVLQAIRLRRRDDVREVEDFLLSLLSDFVLSH